MPVNDESNVTEVSEGDFSVALPGIWKPADVDEGWKYVRDGGHQELIVSALRATKPLTSLEIHDIVARLTSIRREAHSNFSENRVEIGPTEVRACGDRVEARFQGIDHAHGVRFSVTIRGNKARFVTASLYHIGSDDPGISLDITAAVIFDLLRVLD